MHGVTRQRNQNSRNDNSTIGQLQASSGDPHYEDLELALSIDGETIEYSAEMDYFYTYDYPIAYIDYMVAGPGTIKVDYGNGG